MATEINNAINDCIVKLSLGIVDRSISIVDPHLDAILSKSDLNDSRDFKGSQGVKRLPPVNPGENLQ
jgi:hypothetical protein